MKSSEGVNEKKMSPLQHPASMNGYGARQPEPDNPAGLPQPEWSKIAGQRHGRSDAAIQVEHRDENAVPKRMKIPPPGAASSGRAHQPGLRAAVSRDWSRGPLKKRPTTPVPPPSRPPTFTTSSQRFVPMAPFLRQTSSTFSIYQHHDLVPPQLCFASSRGQQLISEPLVETPKSDVLQWPHLAQTPASTTGSASRSTFNDRSTFNEFSPGLDLLAQQVMKEHPALLTVGNHPGAMHTTRLDENVNPFTKVPIDSNVQPDANRTTLPFGFQHQVFPSAPSHMVIPDEMRSHPQVVRSASGFGFSTRSNKGEKKDTLFANVEMTDRPCKCGNSRCLQLYCECFHSGVFCDPKLCKCKDCCNNEEHNAPRGDRAIALKKVLARRPDAFSFKAPKKTGKGCGCKKSGCLKKYCDCVALGRTCSGNCKCSGCENLPYTAEYRDPQQVVPYFYQA